MPIEPWECTARTIEFSALATPEDEASPTTLCAYVIYGGTIVDGDLCVSDTQEDVKEWDLGLATVEYVILDAYQHDYRPSLCTCLVVVKASAALLLPFFCYSRSRRFGV